MERIINGSHRNRNEGYYEWWYFHLLTDDGITANIVLHETDIFGHSKNPYISMSVCLPDNSHQYHRMKIANGSIAKNTLYLQIDDGSIVETEKSTDLSLSFPSGVILKGSILKLFQPLSIENGVLYEDKGKGKSSFWVIQIPYGILKGALTIDGKSYKVEAVVYQDHQWGNVPIQDFVSDWVWGNFGNQSCTVTFFEILTQEGVRVSRFARATKKGIDFSSGRNKVYYLDTLIKSDKPYIFEDDINVEFSLNGKIKFAIKPANLLRSRIDEDYREFRATYLRWTSIANHTLNELSCDMRGITEYFRIRKQNNQILIVLVGFSCTGKSTIAKKLADLYKLELIDQYNVYHSIAVSKGYKRSRDWLKDVGNTIFVEETVRETIKRFRSVDNKMGAVIDASYGPLMHSVLYSELPYTRIITISVLTNRNLRLQRMMIRMSVSSREAMKELTFRDNFLKAVRIKAIMSKCNLEIFNDSDIVSAVKQITQWLTKENIR